MGRHCNSDLAGAIEDMSREDAAAEAHQEREAAAARNRAGAAEPPEDFDVATEDDDSQYCTCGNQPTIEEGDWGVCMFCGKDLS